MPSGSPMDTNQEAPVRKPRYLKNASTRTMSAMPTLAAFGAAAGSRRIMDAQTCVSTAMASGRSTSTAFHVAQNATLAMMMYARRARAGNVQKMATATGNSARYEYELNCIYSLTGIT